MSLPYGPLKQVVAQLQIHDDHVKKDEGKVFVGAQNDTGQHKEKPEPYKLLMLHQGRVHSGLAAELRAAVQGVRGQARQDGRD